MAGHLGMTVKQLLDNTDSEELSEWMALKRLENKEYKQAELAAKAEASERNYRSKRKWQR